MGVLHEWLLICSRDWFLRRCEVVNFELKWWALRCSFKRVLSKLWTTPLTIAETVGTAQRVPINTHVVSSARAIHKVVR